MCGIRPIGGPSLQPLPDLSRTSYAEIRPMRRDDCEERPYGTVHEFREGWHETFFVTGDAEIRGDHLSPNRLKR